MKTLIKLANTRSRIPVLNTIKADMGYVTAYDLDTLIQEPSNLLPEGLYDAKAMGAGINKLADIPLADYPDAHNLGKELSSHTIDKAGLESLAWVAKVMSNEETRYYLMGISFDKEGLAVATDGHRAHISARVGSGFSGMICPSAAIKYVLALVREHKESLIYMTMFDNGFLFKGSKGWTLTTKHIDGTYPDWRRIVPDYSKAKHVSGFALSADLVKKAKAVSTIKGAAVKITPEGTYGMAGDKLDALTLPITVGFNAAYLHELGEGTLSLLDASSPARLVQANGDYGVCMPMRVY